MTREVEEVLGQVARRQGLRSLGRSTFFWTCVFSGIYAAALLATRLLAVWPEWFSTWTLLLPPAAGLVCGLIARLACGLSRGDGADLAGAARAADGHLGTDDLFLTTLQADRVPGEYAPLVRHHASVQADKVRPAEVAPLPFFPRTAWIALTLAALWIAAASIPQLDLLGSGEERLLLGQQKKKLTAEQTATNKRKEALAKKRLDERNSTDVSEALKEVMQTFKKMRQRTQQKNEGLLKRQQVAIGIKWRQARSQGKKRGGPSPQLQSLGAMRNPKMVESWRKDLASNKTDSLRRELKDLRDMLQKMASAGSDAEREKLRKKLQQRTKDLAEFVKNNASSRQLNEALAKALNQLQALGNKKLAAAAEKALNQTFELSDMELKNLAQALRDMKGLQKALETLQLARQANTQGCCKGGGKGGQGEGQGDKGKGKDGQGEGGSDGLGTLEAYEKYYQDLLAQQGEGGKGPGMGGPGQGEGGVAPENPNQKNKFKTEKARSALLAGKMLMSLKTKEVGDRGKIEQNYATQLSQVKQGVGEAILQERVPPGYHSGIQKYFDNLGEKKAGGKKK